MTIIHDLPWLADWLGISPDQLNAYMAETYPGMDDNKVLYSFVRALKPSRCLEIGTGQGGSAGIIAWALERNGKGHLLTVDIDPSTGLHQTPERLGQYVTYIQADANVLIDQLSGYDFIYEDGNHSMHQIHAVYNRVQDGLLNSGGIILSHDALMFSDTPGLDSIGEYIRYGIEAAGLTFPPVEYLRPVPESCGFTVYRKP